MNASDRMVVSTALFGKAVSLQLLFRFDDARTITTGFFRSRPISSPLS